MDPVAMFISTFSLVFFGELGDKTQIAAGTGTLANRNRVLTIYMSSCLALTSVAAITVFLAGLLPQTWLPTLTEIGGIMLILYGFYLLFKTSALPDDTVEKTKGNNWQLFLSQFTVVFFAELGDKTQLATLAAAIANRDHLLAIFLASATALVLVTTITVLVAVTITPSWLSTLQRLGALLMISYGVYILCSVWL